VCDAGASVRQTIAAAAAVVVDGRAASRVSAGDRLLRSIRVCCWYDVAGGWRCHTGQPCHAVATRLTQLSERLGWTMAIALPFVDAGTELGGVL